jgi:serine/threonine-protein kinase
MDFGAALVTGDNASDAIPPVLGTPDYMAPEQVEGQPGDARSDVYSVGVLLYELLTGAPPFRGDNALAVMMQHLQALPPPLRAHNRNVSAALEAVVMKALRKNPAERYQSMAALREDLERLSG